MDERKKRAGFTTIEESEDERFIKRFRHYTSIVSGRLLNVKRFSNSTLDKTKRVITRINYKKISSDLSVWLIETFIEGITANFATNQLFGVAFNIPMIMAHGIIINQSLSIIKRIGDLKNGPNNELPAEKYSD
jgi:hypothetical protein